MEALRGKPKDLHYQILYQLVLSDSIEYTHHEIQRDTLRKKSIPSCFRSDAKFPFANEQRKRVQFEEKKGCPSTSTDQSPAN